MKKQIYYDHNKKNSKIQSIDKKIEVNIEQKIHIYIVKKT